MAWPRRRTTSSWLSRLVALLGLVNVVSALVPAWRGRLELLAEVLPAVAPATATAGAAAAGVLLVVLARGPRRSKRRAWWLPTLLAAVAVVLNLAKGLDVEEALLAAAVGALLVAGRRNSAAVRELRSGRRTAVEATAMVVVVGMTSLGWTLLTSVYDGQQPGTTAVDRLLHAGLGLVSVPGPVRFTSPDAAGRVTVALLVLGVGAALTVLGAALPPPGGPHLLAGEDEQPAAGLLNRHGDSDSLSYFALRRHPRLDGAGPRVRCMPQCSAPAKTRRPVTPARDSTRSSSATRRSCRWRTSVWKAVRWALFRSGTAPALPGAAGRRMPPTPSGSSRSP